MSYIEENLLSDEKILLRAKITPAIFISPFLVFILSLVLFSICINQGSKHTDAGSIVAGLFLCGSGIFFITSFFLSISEVVRFLTTEFAVTNRRVIAKTGFIRRNSLDLRLQKVESVEVNQNLLGRLLSFGTITLTGTGGTRQSFRGIIDPIKTKKRINQIVEHFNSQGANQPRVD